MFRSARLRLVPGGVPGVSRFKQDQQMKITVLKDLGQRVSKYNDVRCHNAQKIGYTNTAFFHIENPNSFKLFLGKSLVIDHISARHWYDPPKGWMIIDSIFPLNRFILHLVVQCFCCCFVVTVSNDNNETKQFGWPGQLPSGDRANQRCFPRMVFLEGFPERCRFWFT